MNPPIPLTQFCKLVLTHFPKGSPVARPNLPHLTDKVFLDLAYLWPRLAAYCLAPCICCSCSADPRQSPEQKAFSHLQPCHVFLCPGIPLHGWQETQALALPFCCRSSPFTAECSGRRTAQMLTARPGLGHSVFWGAQDLAGGRWSARMC